MTFSPMRLFLAPREARSLWGIEKRIRAGDAAAIALVQSWSAKELAEKFSSRGGLPALLGLTYLLICLAIPAIGPNGCLVSALIASVCITIGGILMDSVNRRSPTNELIQDPEWINVSLQILAYGPSAADLQRLLPAAVSSGQFKLTSASEQSFRESLAGYLKAPADLPEEAYERLRVAAELLARFGQQVKTAEFLARAVDHAALQEQSPSFYLLLQDCQARFRARMNGAEAVA